MKIVFFGTPEFAVPFLDYLNNDNTIEIEAVITQPDKKAGRKNILTAPPVKIKAQELRLSVLQPKTLKNNDDLINLLKGLKPDFFVVIAYGKILPEEIFNIPKYGSINVHASLLPKYRGASPIQSALLNGDKETGLSIMQISKGLDEGDIFLLKKETIKDEDNYESLAKRLSQTGALLLPSVLKDIKNRVLTPIEQNDDKATKCVKFSKEDALIKPAEQEAEHIINKFKAFTPWPGIFMVLNNKRLKILEVSAENKETGIKPGELKAVNKQLLLGTKKGILNIPLIQPEGKNPMKAPEFINGFLR